MLGRGWDDKLLSRALLANITPCDPLPDSIPEASIKAAYDYCSRLTAIHSKSFFMASGLMPEAKKRAVRALYAFCRTTDDIVDLDYSGNNDIRLWTDRSVLKAPQVNDPVSLAWTDTRHRYSIPCQYAKQLLEGVETDLVTKRYETFEDLIDYCYGVASTVGLMSMHIVGYTSPEAIPYAIRLGVALQLTNILRDIHEDYQRGRIYLPMEELYDFGISEYAIGAGVNDNKWRAFMRFQIRRNREIYKQAWPGIQLLHKSGRLSIAAAATFYREILRAIEARNYDVFNSRAVVSKWEKVQLIPQLWIDYGLKRDFTPQPITSTANSA